MNNCLRVLSLTQKPSAEQFNKIVKVTATGILFIGAIGYITILIW